MKKNLPLECQGLCKLNWYRYCLSIKKKYQNYFFLLNSYYETKII